jgi:hypothetical protein
MFEIVNYKEIASFIIASMFLALSLWLDNTGAIVMSFILLFVLQTTEFEVRIGKINIKW